MARLASFSGCLRDLKSSNALLSADGIVVKVADVGSAALVGAEGLANDRSLGTMAWAAPELLAGATVDAKVLTTRSKILVCASAIAGGAVALGAKVLALYASWMAGCVGMAGIRPVGCHCEWQHGQPARHVTASFKPEHVTMNALHRMLTLAACAC